jgi:hypothetical protein
MEHPSRRLLNVGLLVAYGDPARVDESYFRRSGFSCVLTHIIF